MFANAEVATFGPTATPSKFSTIWVPVNAAGVIGAALEAAATSAVVIAPRIA